MIWKSLTSLSCGSAGSQSGDLHENTLSPTLSTAIQCLTRNARLRIRSTVQAQQRIHLPDGSSRNQNRGIKCPEFHPSLTQDHRQRMSRSAVRVCRTKLDGINLDSTDIACPSGGYRVCETFTLFCRIFDYNSKAYVVVPVIVSSLRLAVWHDIRVSRFVCKQLKRRAVT